MCDKEFEFQFITHKILYVSPVNLIAMIARRHNFRIPTRIRYEREDYRTRRISYSFTDTDGKYFDVDCGVVGLTIKPAVPWTNWSTTSNGRIDASLYTRATQKFEYNSQEDSSETNRNDLRQFYFHETVEFYREHLPGWFDTAKDPDFCEIYADDSLKTRILNVLVKGLLSVSGYTLARILRKFSRATTRQKVQLCQSVYLPPDNSMLLSVISSAIMHDSQQDNLNAKHARDSSVASIGLDRRDSPRRSLSNFYDKLYIPITVIGDKPLYHEFMLIFKDSSIWLRDDEESLSAKFRASKCLCAWECFDALDSRLYVRLQIRVANYGAFCRYLLECEADHPDSLLIYFSSLKNDFMHFDKYVRNFVRYNVFYHNGEQLPTSLADVRLPILFFYCIAVYNWYNMLKLLRRSRKRTNICISQRSQHQVEKDPLLAVFSYGAIQNVMNYTDEHRRYRTEAALIARYFNEIAHCGINGISYARSFDISVIDRPVGRW